MFLHSVIAVRNRKTGVIECDVKVRQEFASRVAKLLPDWEQLHFIKNKEVRNYSILVYFVAL